MMSSGLSCFWDIDVNEMVQNQSRKTSVIRLPRFTTENIAKKWPQNANFSIKNLVFDNYCFVSLMRGVFLDWFLALFYIWTPQKHGTFGLVWKHQGCIVYFHVATFLPKFEISKKDTTTVHYFSIWMLLQEIQLL